MGCASSSPLVSAGESGGLVDSAKTAATEVISSAENTVTGKCFLTSLFQCILSDLSKLAS